MPALESGIICLWSGSIATIPGGWYLCDGNNGTPDLRDSFLVGAGSTYAVGATGGVSTHNHTLTTDGHTHDIPLGPAIAEGAVRDYVTDSATDTATTSTENHLPPYYALCYIMKS